MSAARSRSGFTPASGELAGRRFPSKQAYRNALAQTKGYANDYQLRQARKRTNRLSALEGFDPEERRARDRALEALRLMRVDGLPLQRAAEHVGTTPRTMRKYVGVALRKSRGAYHATPHDRLLRPLAFLTDQGNVTVWVRSSREASVVARYQNAVRFYVQTGDASEMEAYRGQSIRDTNGKTWPFLTDLKTVRRLGNAGVLRFESIYREAA